MQKKVIERAFINNLGLKLTAAAVSIVIWLVVIASKSIEATKEVPIVYRTRSGIVVGPGSPEKILFRLSGSRAFLRSVLDRNDSITVDLVQEKSGSALVRFFSDSIEVPLGVKVLEVTPSITTIRLERERKKRVALRLVFSGAPPEGYEIEDAKIEPDKAMIIGPQSEIPEIKWVQTVPIELNDLKGEIQLPVSLQEVSSTTKIEVSKRPVATIKVKPIIKPYQIPNVTLIALNNEYQEVRLSPSKVKISIEGIPHIVNELDIANLKVFVDLKELNKKKSGSLPIKAELPEGVRFIKAFPERAKVRVIR